MVSDLSSHIIKTQNVTEIGVAIASDNVKDTLRELNRRYHRISERLSNNKRNIEEELVREKQMFVL